MLHRIDHIITAFNTAHWKLGAEQINQMRNDIHLTDIKTVTQDAVKHGKLSTNVHVTFVFRTSFQRTCILNRANVILILL